LDPVHLQEIVYVRHVVKLLWLDSRAVPCFKMRSGRGQPSGHFARGSASGLARATPGWPVSICRVGSAGLSRFRTKPGQKKRVGSPVPQFIVASGARKKALEHPGSTPAPDSDEKGVRPSCWP